MATDNFMARRRKLIEHELATTPGILEELYAKQGYRQAGHNVDLIARALLQRGMMAARVEGDFQSARADFARASGLTREFDRALEGIRQSGRKPMPPQWFACLDIQDFEIPLFACVLAQDWPRVEAVARITRDPHVLELEDPTKVLMTRMLAAFVIDERTSFAQVKSVYDKSKKSTWWKHFVHYVDMYESVLNRDQGRYDELADNADKLYRARARDRKFGDLRAEYGGLAENERMLDFIALAIAIVAVKRGMRAAGKESGIVPAALIAAPSAGTLPHT
jgi:hypothetical protein